MQTGSCQFSAQPKQKECPQSHVTRFGSACVNNQVWKEDIHHNANCQCMLPDLLSFKLIRLYLLNFDSIAAVWTRTPPSKYSANVM